jgi:hypothetical protein
MSCVKRLSLICSLGLLGGMIFFDCVPAAAQQPEIPPVTTNNKNTLLKKYRPQLKLNASSVWPGWPTGNAFDENPQTSWFSARGDAAALGQKPWVEFTFPEDVTVKRVTVLGNRDPAWLKGFTILGGQLEVFDKDGKKLYSSTNDGIGPASDFDFRMTRALSGIRIIRFTALGDQGKENGYDDIAIGEIQVE